MSYSCADIGYSWGIAGGLFDCHDVDLYSKNIRIEFLERVRDEIKFVSIDDLVAQLTQDKNHCLGLLKKYY